MVENINLLKSMAELIPYGVITADIYGNIINTNTRVLEMFGYTSEKIKGITLKEILNEWDDVLYELTMKKDIRDREIYLKVIKNKVQFKYSAHAVCDHSNEITEVLLLFDEMKKERKLAGRIASGRAVYSFGKIIGSNKEFLKVIQFCKKISESKSTVLISGESGTGKEVFAQSIHNYSDRKDEAFVALNCGAIPGNLIESELFGYEDGAFTGAKKGGYTGKFALAHEGTLFLDEIGEMPLEMQTKLLRAIEEKVINKIGGQNPIPVNVRIVAATNKDLKREVEEGRFRKDLYYRLNVLPVYLPPLRERTDDIPELIEFFMIKISKRLNKRRVKIPKGCMNKMKRYAWPGNIRELENIIELIINTEVVPIQFQCDELRERKKEIESQEENLTMERVECEHIIKVLKKAEGNITLASKLMKIGRNTLYRKLEKYNIENEECS